ncbi:MAG: aspartate carbamoyltransferase catalytic subunit, partial [Candidatus Portiera sp.]|nr:aspartate carbamoyltransferase catalytic subunit [Portiera sp.]
MIDSNPPASPHNFIGIEPLSSEQLHNLLALAKELAECKNIEIYGKRLADKSIVTLFYEPSTRTRSSFTLAAYRLGANTLDLVPSNSALEKGENLLDTFMSLQAMNPDLFVVRHSGNDVIKQLVEQLYLPLVNAGDGTNEHPSQTLLDLLTILLHKGDAGDISKLKIALVGDLAHSRVARSFIYAMDKIPCAELRLIGPAELLADDFPVASNNSNIIIERDMDKGLEGVDLVMMLRIQRERIAEAKQQGGILANPDDYFSLYGLSPERLELAAPDALVMHPGPVNRGVEISSEVVDGPRSLILKQIEYGVYVRMAIFLSLL